jgi:lipopolysaccharide export system protein LptA
VTLRVCVALGLVLTMAAPLAGQARSKRCLMEIENINNRGTYLEFAGANSNYFAGGNVRLRCRNQNVRLGADSIEAINGEVVHLLGKAFYRDANIDVTADELTYYISQESIQGRSRVHVVDRKTGSSLSGPNVNFLRAAQGVRDSSSVLAIDYPTVRLFASGADTTRTHPWVLRASVLNGFGESTFWGSDSVTLDRDSVHATADSIYYRTAKQDTLTLTGAPATLERIGADTLQVHGGIIRLGLDADRIRNIMASDSAHATNGSTEVVGGKLVFEFSDEKLVRLSAWDSHAPATVHREGYDLVGDSVVVETPGEQLRGFRIFGHGLVRSPRDTMLVGMPEDSAMQKVPDRDTIWGSHIVADFAQVDSAGQQVTRIQKIESIGSAASFAWRNTTEKGVTRAVPAYLRADTVLVLMKGGDSTGISEVRYRGHADGMMLRKGTVKAAGDTLAVKPKGGGA